MSPQEKAAAAIAPFRFCSLSLSALCLAASQWLLIAILVEGDAPRHGWWTIAYVVVGLLITGRIGTEIAARLRSEPDVEWSIVPKGGK